MILKPEAQSDQLQPARLRIPIQAHMPSPIQLPQSDHNQSHPTASVSPSQTIQLTSSCL